MEYRGFTGAEAEREGRRHLMLVDLLRFIASDQPSDIARYLSPDLNVSQPMQAVGRDFIVRWRDVETNDEGADLIDDEVRSLQAAMSKDNFIEFNLLGDRLESLNRYDGTLGPDYYGALFTAGVRLGQLAVGPAASAVIEARIAEWWRVRQLCVADDLDTTDEGVWEANAWRFRISRLIDKTAWDRLAGDLVDSHPEAVERVVEPFRQSLVDGGLSSQDIVEIVPGPKGSTDPTVPPT